MAKPLKPFTPKATSVGPKTAKPVPKPSAVSGSSDDCAKAKKQTKQKKPAKKSGYLIFSMRKRKEIIEQEPYKSMKQPDVFKAIGQMWKELSAEEQNAFKEEAKKENEQIIEDVDIVEKENENENENAKS